MYQCLRIIFSLEVPKNFLSQVVQKHARELHIEGTAQVLPDNIKIVACGEKDNVQQFVDFLHNELSKKSVEIKEIEPFIKDKDYRGVFRVIE